MSDDLYDFGFADEEEDETWPASREDRLGGDAFGNGSKYLWHCQICDGYFVAMDPKRAFVTYVGLIPYLENPEWKRLREAETEAKSRQLVAQQPCDCDYHHPWSRRSWL